MINSRVKQVEQHERASLISNEIQLEDDENNENEKLVDGFNQDMITTVAIPLTEEEMETYAH